MTSTGVESCAFFNPSDLSDKTDPPIKLYSVQVMYTDRDTKNIKEGHGITLTSCIMNPEARGEVLLRSSDPLDLPLVNPNFFSNNNDLNLMQKRSVELSFKISPELWAKKLNFVINNDILRGGYTITNESIKSSIKSSLSLLSKEKISILQIKFNNYF